MITAIGLALDNHRTGNQAAAQRADRSRPEPNPVLGLVRTPRGAACRAGTPGTPTPAGSAGRDQHASHTAHRHPASGRHGQG